MLNINLHSVFFFFVFLFITSLVQAQSYEQPSIEVRCQVTMTPPLQTISYRFIGRRDNQMNKTYSGKVKMFVENDSLIYKVQSYQPEINLYIDSKTKREIPTDYNPSLVEIDRLYLLPGGDNNLQSAFYILDPEVFSKYKEIVNFPAFYQLQMNGDYQLFEANCSLKQFRTKVTLTPEINVDVYEASTDLIE